MDGHRPSPRCEGRYRKHHVVERDCDKNQHRQDGKHRQRLPRLRVAGVKLGQGFQIDREHLPVSLPTLHVGMFGHQCREQFAVDAFHIRPGLQTDISVESIAIVPAKMTKWGDGTYHIELQMAIRREIFKDSGYLITIRLLLIPKENFTDCIFLAEDSPSQGAGKKYLVADFQPRRVACEYGDAKCAEKSRICINELHIIAIFPAKNGDIFSTHIQNTAPGHHARYLLSHRRRHGAEYPAIVFHTRIIGAHPRSIDSLQLI